MLDYHVHTWRCKHAVGKIGDYVEAAASRGLKEIGFSDHYPIFYFSPLPYEDYSMDLSELPAYAGEVEEAKERFKGRVEVKVGVEVDYCEGCEPLLKEALTSQEFDYVVGAVHFVDGWAVDDERNLGKYKEYDLDALYAKYFGALKALIKSGLFDVVAHLDVIKKFGFVPEGGVERYLLPCLDLIAEEGVCAEINTSGLDGPAKETYPGLKFLKEMRDRGVQVTLGSDAHKPRDVARHFDTVLRELKKSGYRKLVSFTKREKTLRSI